MNVVMGYHKRLHIATKRQGLPVEAFITCNLQKMESIDGEWIITTITGRAITTVEY